MDQTASVGEDYGWQRHVPSPQLVVFGDMSKLNGDIPLGKWGGGTGHIPTHMTSVPYLLLPLLGLFKTFSIQPFPAKYASCQAEQWGERGRLFSGQEASVAAVRAR